MRLDTVTVWPDLKCVHEPQHQDGLAEWPWVTEATLVNVYQKTALSWINSTLHSQFSFKTNFNIILKLCLRCSYVLFHVAMFVVHRTNKYLQKSSITRVCAVGGFFISIPVFLTGKSIGEIKKGAVGRSGSLGLPKRLYVRKSTMKQAEVWSDMPRI